MAPGKRKGDGAIVADVKRPHKKVKILADAQSKEPKASRTLKTATESKKQTSSDAHESAKRPSNTSIFREEEPSFPRGGGSLLTPIEKRQIQAQAQRDVLFEQQGLGQDAGEFESEDDDFGETGRPSSPVHNTKRARKLGKLAVSSKQSAAVRVEGLNFKVRDIDVCTLFARG
jgi:rRNA biogenesis protein RRP5